MSGERDVLLAAAYRLLAWIVAEETDAEAVAAGREAPLLGREVRCALVTASLHSLSDNISPELLQALVKSGIWKPRAALTPRDMASWRKTCSRF